MVAYGQRIRGWNGTHVRESTRVVVRRAEKRDWRATRYITCARGPRRVQSAVRCAMRLWPLFMLLFPLRKWNETC